MARTLTVVIACVECHTVIKLKVDPADYAKWQAGELIQRAMPYLDVGERELLISGICSTCFDQLFRGDDGEEDEEVEQPVCQCEHTHHFDPKDKYHDYGAMVPRVTPVVTPFSTFEVCDFCRDNCLKEYKQNE